MSISSVAAVDLRRPAAGALAGPPSPHPSASPTRRFDTLDAMRGVAAIAVVTTHAEPFLGGVPLPNGSLAVDLFFLLSGFVLTHAYSERLDADASAGGFLGIRLVRLWPLYMVGAVLGSLLFALQLATGAWELGVAGSVLAVVSLWLMMPSPIPNRFDEVFLINGPRWSLFYELAVNVLMAVSWKFLRPNRRLIPAVLLLGVILAATMRHYHTVELGWSSRTLVAGFARVSFPFFAGVLIYRLHGSVQVKSRAAILLPLLLLPTFAILPHREVAYALACILVVFPVLVFLGARFQPPTPRISRMLGELSYPLYIIHVPLLGLAELALRLSGRSPQQGQPYVGILLLAAIIALSLVLARKYDPAARRSLAAMVFRARA